MKLTIKHLYKEEEMDWNCQFQEYTNVKYFETFRDQDGIMWLEIYYKDEQKQNDYIDITNEENTINFLECSIEK